jgi:hypothetical protein
LVVADSRFLDRRGHPVASLGGVNCGCENVTTKTRHPDIGLCEISCHIGAFHHQMPRPEDDDDKMLGCPKAEVSYVFLLIWLRYSTDKTTRHSCSIGGLLLVVTYVLK